MARITKKERFLSEAFFGDAVTLDMTMASFGQTPAQVPQATQESSSRVQVLF
jgi:hypothetical protein